MKIIILIIATALAALPLSAGGRRETRPPSPSSAAQTAAGEPAAAQPSAAQPSATGPAEGSAAALLAHAGLDIPDREISWSDFTLESLDGRKVALSSFKGKLVFLSFWATWCPPCRKEMPELQAAYEKLKTRGFVIVAVDLAEKKSTAADFIKKAGYTFPVLLDTDGRVGSAYGASSIPTNYIIDRGGKILARKVGLLDLPWDGPEMTGLLERLLAL